MNKILLPFLATSLFSSFVYAEELKCPQHIETQQSLSQEHDGFDRYSRVLPNELLAVGFTDGHPDEKRLIKPDAEGPNGEPKYEFFTSRDIWMLCYYSNTEVTLMKNIGQQKTCTVTESLSQCD